MSKAGLLGVLATEYGFLAAGLAVNGLEKYLLALVAAGFITWASLRLFVDRAENDNERRAWERETARLIERTKATMRREFQRQIRTRRRAG